jgi:decaprenyl-phosphate phosphoribosyltransferase
LEGVRGEDLDRPAVSVADLSPAITGRSVGAALRACRPRQWCKNDLVAFAPVAGGALTRSTAVREVFGAFVAFCLLSSATYLVNDVRDRQQDRLHPTKRIRPIAAGQLSPQGALRLARALAGVGLVLAVLIRPALAAVGVAYLAMTLSYSLWWRRIPVLDIAAVAYGFVLRAIAGGAATGITPSRSFLLVTYACALFVVVGKRYAELFRGCGATRRTLRHYSPEALRRLLAASAVLGCIAYARWASARTEHELWLELSLLPFAMWLHRYATLIGAGAGEAPEELVLADRSLLALACLWALLFVGDIYGAR